MTRLARLSGSMTGQGENKEKRREKLFTGNDTDIREFCWQVALVLPRHRARYKFTLDLGHKCVDVLHVVGRTIVSNAEFSVGSRSGAISEGENQIRMSSLALVVQYTCREDRRR